MLHLYMTSPNIHFLDNKHLIKLHCIQTYHIWNSSFYFKRILQFLLQHQSIQQNFNLIGLLFRYFVYQFMLYNFTVHVQHQYITKYPAIRMVSFMNVVTNIMSQKGETDLGTHHNQSPVLLKSGQYRLKKILGQL